MQLKLQEHADRDSKASDQAEREKRSDHQSGPAGRLFWRGDEGDARASPLQQQVHGGRRQKVRQSKAFIKLNLDYLDNDNDILSSY